MIQTVQIRLGSKTIYKRTNDGGHAVEPSLVGCAWGRIAVVTGRLVRAHRDSSEEEREREGAKTSVCIGRELMSTRRQASDPCTIDVGPDSLSQSEGPEHQVVLLLSVRHEHSCARSEGRN
jgi:hypothetical protein